MNLDPIAVAEFRAQVWEHYTAHARTMPWRTNTEPYFVLVSELMLQQTQVSRVIPKFEAFIARFPTAATLAAAPLADVLRLWSGLGYNRRAKFLWQAAQQVVAHYDGQLPSRLDELQTLPGIGPNTAGAIAAYAYNRPVVFIETNIRTVYFYHFFAERNEVSDDELRSIVEATLDEARPREWYWALMDYGNYLKTQGKGAIGKSRHYRAQSPLGGSMRQMRGHILRVLSAGPLQNHILREQVEVDERFEPALKALEAEGLVERHNDIVRLHGHGQGHNQV